MFDKSVQKSCWGITAWAVTGIAAVLFIIWMSGADRAIALASSG